MSRGPSSIADWIVPDRIGPVDISKVCAAHDRAYASGVTSRTTADTWFYRDLLSTGSDLVGSVGRSYRRPAFPVLAGRTGARRALLAFEAVGCDGKKCHFPAHYSGARLAKTTFARPSRGQIAPE